jgi:hypothetical protein
MQREKALIGLRLVNTAALVLVLAVNALANALPLNGNTTGELSARYPNLFVPAGLTFSIWGLIYLLLVVFVVFQLLRRPRRGAVRSSFQRRIGPAFLVSCLANAGWIFAWHYERVLLSLAVMVILLLSLIQIYLRLGIGRPGALRREQILVHLPFSVYLGWITIATIANAAACLVHLRWNRFGLGEPFWTVLMIAAGIALALLALYRRGDIFYALVVDWALLGILLKRLAEDAEPRRAILAALAAGLALVTAGTALQILRRRVYRIAISEHGA